MPSQAQTAQRGHLVRRVPPSTSPLRTSPLARSQLQRPNPNLVRRIAPLTGRPISPPRTSPQSETEHDEDNGENNDEDDEEELGQKRKQGCNLLPDALELEVTRKKRKRGIIKQVPKYVINTLI